MGTARGVPRAHAHGGAHGRSRGGRLRGAVALVGRGPGGLLGRDLAPLRSRRGLRPRARRAVDAGRRVVPGRDAQLRRAPVPRQARRPHGDPPRLGAARPGVLDLGRAARADGRDPRRARGARRRAAATASPPTCRTCPRRSRPSSPPRRSAPCGPRRRPSSARAASATASRRSSRRCCSPSTATATAARDFDRREAVAEIAARGRRAGRAARLPRRLGLGGRLPRSTAPAGVRAGRRSTIRSGSSTRPARPGCRRRSSRGRAGSCSST